MSTHPWLTRLALGIAVPGAALIATAIAPATAEAQPRVHIGIAPPVVVGPPVYGRPMPPPGFYRGGGPGYGRPMPPPGYYRGYGPPRGYYGRGWNRGYGRGYRGGYYGGPGYYRPYGPPPGGYYGW